ncbi:unnamed protein product [Effrenium voratum]|nr:unnamed protein product [Effrenium voratum]
MARLPAALWGSVEGPLRLLQTMGQVRVTGGWLRDKMLETQGINPDANARWQRLQGLTGHPAGDIDLVVAGQSITDFFALCQEDSFRGLLRKPPLLVPASAAGRAATVKLLLPEASIDITSLEDRAPGRPLEGALEEDWGHRDATFNAMYLEASEEVADPAGGLCDLAAGLVRSPHPGGPKASFEEDPVRLLRLMRFSSRYGFELHEDIRNSAAFTEEQGSSGRVLNELKKALLLHNQPWRFLQLCGDCEVQAALFGPWPGPWPRAVNNVARLGTLLLHGLAEGHVTARSARFRGRIPGGLVPALMRPDWRKLGVWENDWVELLLAALCWRHSAEDVRRLAGRLQLSQTMCPAPGCILAR